MNEREKLIEEIKAFLAKEYRDISFEDIDENGKLYLESHGDCASCPFDCLSKEKGIEAALRERFCEISSVTVQPAVSEELLDLARKMLRHE